MSRNIARIVLSPEQVAKVLRLPEGVNVTGACWNHGPGTLEIYVEGEQIPEAPQFITPLATPLPEWSFR